MLKDITLGQYFPGDTLAHKLDPRTKEAKRDRHHHRDIVYRNVKNYVKRYYIRPILSGGFRHS